jgi:hypothetical protein
LIIWWASVNPAPGLQYTEVSQLRNVIAYNL